MDHVLVFQVVTVAHGTRYEMSHTARLYYVRSMLLNIPWKSRLAFALFFFIAAVVVVIIIIVKIVGVRLRQNKRCSLLLSRSAWIVLATTRAQDVVVGRILNQVLLIDSFI